MLGSETGWLARVSLVPGICWLLLHDAFPAASPAWPVLPPLTQHLVAWQLITKLEEFCYERLALPLQRPNNSSSWASRLAQLPNGETILSVTLWRGSTFQCCHNFFMQLGLYRDHNSVLDFQAWNVPELTRCGPRCLIWGICRVTMGLIIIIH